MSRLPVALWGAGQRARSVYGPLLRGPLSDRIELVGVVGRSEARAAALGATLGVPWGLELDSSWGARGAIVAVASAQNGRVARSVLALGLPALLETPLALEIGDAEELAQELLSSAWPFAVAEQNPRHLGARLLIEACRREVLGTPLVVATEGAGYRYHGLAVARAVLGKPRGRVATGQRVRAALDVGRGPTEEILLGTIRAEGGALVQFRDAEAAWVPHGPWSRGMGRVLGTKGEFVGGSVVQWRDGQRTALAVEPLAGVGRSQGLRLLGPMGFDVLPALPQADLDDDAQAVAGCILDWLARLDGRAVGWGVTDALNDLRWLDGLERSARLGGAAITLAG